MIETMSFSQRCTSLLLVTLLAGGVATAACGAAEPSTQGEGADASASADDAWSRDPRLVEHLVALGPPRLLSIHSQGASGPEMEAALAGEFLIQDRPADMELPVDWLQDPYEDRSWRFWLHSLIVLEPLLQGWETTREPAYLESALALTLDWIESNPRGGRGVSRFAWYDMAVPARAAYMAYLLRAAAVADLLDGETARTLALALEDHADWLAERENYTAGHNHGLYQDAGLYVAGAQLPDHPRSEPWRRTAERRFAETVAATVAVDEGMHLEHSPGYHVNVTNLLARFEELGVAGEGLAGLVERMRESAGWLVMPDGRLPQLGDTDKARAVEWVAERAASRRGLKLFREAGYGIVKEPDAYLILAVGYHGRGHKHADELTLSLYDRGRRILVDAGRYGYYYSDPERIYATSSRAHNGLEMGGEELVWRGTEPYGSGLLGGAEDGGWYALAGRNPLLEPRGLEHRRLVLYRPGEALVVVDRTTAPEPIAVRRHLHFASDLELDDGTATSREIRAAGVAHAAEGTDAADGFRARVCDLSRQPVTARKVQGQREPEVQGFTFPANRVVEPSPTLVLDGRGETAFWVTALDLSPEGGLCSGERRLSLDWDGERLELGRGGPATAVRVRVPRAVGGGELELTVAAAGTVDTPDTPDTPDKNDTNQQGLNP